MEFSPDSFSMSGANGSPEAAVESLERTAGFGPKKVGLKGGLVLSVIRPANRLFDLTIIA
jgi:hypothetical protein